MISIRTSLRSWRCLAAAGAVFAALAGCGDSGDAPSSAKGGDKGKRLTPVEAQTIDARATVISPIIRVQGTLYAIEDLTVSSKVAGRITAIAHDLGDRVEPDMPLAQIDRTDYDLAAQERQLAVSATLAKLGLKEFPSAELDAEEVPTVKSAAVQQANEKAKYERLRKLFEQTPPLISEQEFADARTTLEVAQSAYEVALLNARALLAEARTLAAELNVANQRLSDTQVRAPQLAPDVEKQSANPVLSYAVAERLVSVGEYVREGTPLFRLIDDDPVKLRAMVPERYAGQVEKGMEVKVRVQAHEEEKTGTIWRISPQVDEASRTFVAEVLIANSEGHLKPGAFANATIALRAQMPAVTLPSSAVTSFAGVHKVFRIEDGKAVEQRVELGDRKDDEVIVTKGLSPGERVVLAPPVQMVTGTPVVLPPAPSAE